jgi:hypothetical protein
LLPFDDVGGDARALLRAFVSGFVSEGRAQQIPIRSLSLDADSSATCETDATVEGLPFRFAMTSAVTGKRGVVLVVNGLPENLHAADSHVKAALAGLELSRTPLPKQSVTDGAFTDWRYGFKLAPPAGFTWSGPKEHQRQGLDLFMWSTPGLGIVLAATARRGIADRGLDVMRIVMQQQMKAFAKVAGAPPAMSPATLAGRPGHRMSMENDQMRIDLLATNRGDQVFILTVIQEGEGRSAERAQAAAAAFQLLD